MGLGAGRRGRFCRLMVGDRGDEKLVEGVRGRCDGSGFEGCYRGRSGKSWGMGQGLGCGAGYRKMERRSYVKLLDELAHCTCAVMRSYFYFVLSNLSYYKFAINCLKFE